MLALGGLRNADRYYAPMTPEIEQQMMMAQQAAAAQQQPPQDPLVQAETIKAQAKAQSDMAKIQLDAQKALAQDDRERDRMDQDLVLQAAKIVGEYGQAIDIERIKAAQAEPRFADTSPQRAVEGARY